MAGYTTIEGRAQAEFVEKKSRFIGQIAHVETEEEALAFLEEIRATHRMAKHNVYAYVLRAGGRIRYSDDGEPQKTAGMPTLEAIQHAGLVDVACVVTRYFGGVLLGTGGLVRAYTAATQAAIEAARLVVISRCVDVVAVLPYSLYEQAMRLCDAQGAHVLDTDFAADVTLTVRVLEGNEDALVEALVNLSNGRADLLVGEVVDAAF